MEKRQAGQSRVLMLLANRENRRLLCESLEGPYEVVCPQSESELEQEFDLCILDRPLLARWGQALRARREAETPVFLPFLLVTARQDVSLMPRSVWTVLDEVLLVPIEKLELRARMETLLRARRLSMELKLRNDDLEAFIHALTHDLRAPLRTVTGFAELLAEGTSPRLEPREQHQVARIEAAARQMWELIASLVEFSKIGRRTVCPHASPVRQILDSCVANMEEEIRSSNAQLEILDGLGTVQADAGLLKTALANLISNAIKYVAPGTRPEVRIWATEDRGRCRIHVQDNGIGLPPEDQHKIFTPFFRLHGAEEYPGLGLGLSSSRKIIEIMGGQIGVESRFGQGSTFWIELSVGSET